MSGVISYHTDIGHADTGFYLKNKMIEVLVLVSDTIHVGHLTRVQPDVSVLQRLLLLL